ncbi:hypothetical protein DDE05_28190 [Streptomyces cavourensis]|jgi:hypothetical protein|uniref:hypothetical protein n=1 Tax=unclassified Achromobacter TaxID=2626865 RepID=UPI000DFF6E71|nr:hypothetical protein DDE05_28190 [Streptomyces cavourensis]
MTTSPILRAFLRLGAVLMIAATLTACGGDKDDDSDSGSGAPGGQQPETPTQPVKPQLRCAP